MMTSRVPRTFSAATALVLAATALAGTPTADQLFEKSREAMGGKAIEKVKSYTTSAEMTSPMGTMTVVMSWAESGNVAITQNMPQMGEMKMGSDGKVGWLYHPMMGYQLMEEQQLADMKEQAIHARILNLQQTMKDEGDEVERVTETEFNGVRCYEMQFKQKEGDFEKSSIYFDADTWLIRGMKTAGNSEGTPVVATVTLADWKAIDGVRFFQQVDLESEEMTMGIRYTKIELNSVKPEAFAVPAEVKELIKPEHPDHPE